MKGTCVEGTIPKLFEGKTLVSVVDLEYKGFSMFMIDIRLMIIVALIFYY